MRNATKLPVLVALTAIAFTAFAQGRVSVTNEGAIIIQQSSGDGNQQYAGIGAVGAVNPSATPSGAKQSIQPDRRESLKRSRSIRPGVTSNGTSP